VIALPFQGGGRPLAPHQHRDGHEVAERHRRPGRLGHEDDQTGQTGDDGRDEDVEQDRPQTNLDPGNDQD